MNSNEVDVINSSPQDFQSDVVCVTSSSSRVQTSSVAVEMGRRLLLASRAGDTETILELMAKGAPFTTDWLGTSPLHLAAANDHVETCAVLLRAGVSRDARTKVERTPLHLAAHAGHAGVISLLLSRGALVDCRDMLEMTPLHWAAARGHGEAARALLRGGADPRALCKFRKSPAALAARHAHRHLVELLRDAEAHASLLHTTEQLVDENETAKIQEDFATLQRIAEVEVPEAKLHTAKPVETDTNAQKQSEEKSGSTSAGPGPGSGSGSGSGDAAQLLRRHGITLLPRDTGSTVLSALQSGRTVLLSDAGKLMLKESTESSARKDTLTPAAVKLVSVASNSAFSTLTNNYQQVKIVQLPGSCKTLASPGKGKVTLGKVGTSLGKGFTSLGKIGTSLSKVGAGKAQPVRIVLNKEHLNKLLVSSKNKTISSVARNGNNPSIRTVTVKTENFSPQPDCVLSANEMDAGQCPASASEAELSKHAALGTETGASGVGQACARCGELSAALGAARASLHSLRHQLARCRERLAVYENT